MDESGGKAQGSECRIEEWEGCAAAVLCWVIWGLICARVKG